MTEQEFLIKFGEALKNLRLKNGYSLRDLGHRAGITHTNIYLYENAEKISPNLRTVFRLAQALKIEPAELIQ